MRRGRLGSPAGTRGRLGSSRESAGRPASPTKRVRRLAFLPVSTIVAVSLPPRFEPRLTLAPAPPSAGRGPCRRLSLPFSCAQIILTGMGRTLVDEMVKVVSDNHGTAPPCREPKYRPLHYGRAGRLPHSRRGAAFQPRCSMEKGGWTHGRRYAQGGTRGRHAVSHPRIKLSSTLAARGTALRPPPARPPPSARRGGRAVPPRVRPADSHARSCARVASSRARGRWV